MFNFSGPFKLKVKATLSDGLNEALSFRKPEKNKMLMKKEIDFQNKPSHHIINIMRINK